MTKPEKGKASTVLLSMTPEKFAKHLRDLKDLHDAADDAAMAVASGYKGLKKQGMNLDALKIVRRLQALGNAAKVSAFLADFDRMRELAGLDAQLNLFEEDKTAVQRQGESGKVVELKPGNAKAAENPAAEKADKADPKPKKTAAAKDKAPKAAVTKAALFDTGDGDGASDAEVAAISEEEKARQDGLAVGASGADYENPFEQGPLKDAWHSGYVSGADSDAASEGQKASA